MLSNLRFAAIVLGSFELAGQVRNDREQAAAVLAGWSSSNSMVNPIVTVHLVHCDSVFKMEHLTKYLLN